MTNRTAAQETARLALAAMKAEDDIRERRETIKMAHYALESARHSSTDGARTRSFYQYMELMGRAGLGFNARDWAAREAVEHGSYFEACDALDRIHARWY